MIYEFLKHQARGSNHQARGSNHQARGSNHQAKDNKHQARIMLFLRSIAECDRSQLISISPRKITRFESLPVGQAFEAGFYGLDENGSSTREQSSTLQQ